MSRQPRRAKARSVAYVLDPRFPGGTSAAVARELAVVSQFLRPRVYAISSRMFSGDQPAPALAEVLDDLGLELVWDPDVISADVVILHNPSFLKFDTALGARIVAGRLIVVSHENFLRPGGQESFDVAGCLGVIDRAVLALDKVIAPVSGHNRATVIDWLARAGQGDAWSVLPDDWFNICDFEMAAPSQAPRDRRGRLSRPGFEKFPPLADMEASFPPEAECNLLLGADTLVAEAASHPHWEVVPFRAMEVAEFFEEIDFFVYFTSPMLRESFGRVLAEAIAAGKLVISDADTAANFGRAVVAAQPAEVSGLIAKYIAAPGDYGAQVRLAQAELARFSSSGFAAMFKRQVLQQNGARHDTD